jgi:hypothetical protein
MTSYTTIEKHKVNNKIRLDLFALKFLFFSPFDNNKTEGSRQKEY